VFTEDCIAANSRSLVNALSSSRSAEKRRRRKKGSYPTPAKHLHIHEAVCEGCGDCGQQSNCVSLLPLETEFGRKRRIDDSNCNKC